MPGGPYKDAQTDNVTSYFYSSSGNELIHLHTRHSDPCQYPCDWDRVWFVRNC
jgi:hypothetical protein